MEITPRQCLTANRVLLCRVKKCSPVHVKQVLCGLVILTGTMLLPIIFRSNTSKYMFVLS